MIQHIKKTKDKNHVIIAIDVVKAFDKIQHSFIVKTHSNMDIEGTYLNIIKAIHACLVSSVVSDTATSQTGASQAPLSLGFSRQEYWSGLLCPPPGSISNPGIEPMSLTSTCTARHVL